MHQIQFHSALPEPLAGFKGVLLLRDGMGGEGKERGRREGKGKEEGKSKREGEGCVMADRGMDALVLTTVFALLILPLLSEPYQKHQT